MNPISNTATILFEVINLPIKKTIHRMLNMTPAAWYIFIRSIQLTAFVLFCAFVLLLGYEGKLLEHYDLYMTAIMLFETGQALILIGALFSVLIEDVQS